ncbi:MAG: VWA domain-containing protein [Fusobacteriaceae bacterium]|jgi:Mg-chelatase subunit ChlD|nr:VWA domain-containing protein [Fusobacteriaceae bacterium]
MKRTNLILCFCLVTSILLGKETSAPGTSVTTTKSSTSGTTVTTTTTTVTTTTTTKPVKNQEIAKDVEIVFVLDTTGSMDGLINGAKSKIWSIINDVLQNQKSGSKVKIGLVGYRDRGDQYVTKVTGLSEDLDEVYGQLMGFRAEGGGDEPEDVRQALFVGVSKMNWSKPRRNLSRIVFLVGDAMPHTNYQDFPTTVATAKSAKKNGIIINTIQCGNLPRTDKFWREIAQNAGGEYFSIAQDGGIVEITTPYDEEIQNLGNQMDKVYIPFGKSEERESAIVAKEEMTSKLTYAPKEAKVSRSVNKSINKFAYSSDDLVQAIENNETKLGDIKTESLPTEMQSMSKDEQETYINKKIAERKEIRDKILNLSKQRDAYIKENTTTVDSFDKAVSDSLKKQIK